MLKKRKEFKITALQTIILNIIATIISIGGMVAFSILPTSNNWGSALFRTLLLVLSIWNLIFIISQLFSWITTKKELRKKMRDILKEEYNFQNYTFQINVSIGVISIVLILLVIVLLFI